MLGLRRASRYTGRVQQVQSPPDIGKLPTPEPGIEKLPSSESELRRYIVRALTKDGWKIMMMPQQRGVPAKTSSGWPDIFAVKPPRSLALELKSEKGTVSQKQYDWLTNLAASGVESYVLRPSLLEYFHEMILTGRAALEAALEQRKAQENESTTPGP